MSDIANMRAEMHQMQQQIDALEAEKTQLQTALDECLAGNPAARRKGEQHENHHEHERGKR